MFKLKEDLNIYTSSEAETWQGFIDYLMSEVKKQRASHPQRPYVYLQGTLILERITARARLFYLQIEDQKFYESSYGGKKLDFFTILDANGFNFDGRADSQRAHFLRKEFFEGAILNEKNRKKRILTRDVMIQLSEDNVCELLDHKPTPPEDLMRELILDQNNSFFRRALFGEVRFLTIAARAFWGIDYQLGLEDYMSYSPYRKLHAILKERHLPSLGLKSCEDVHRMIRALLELKRGDSFTIRQIDFVLRKFGATIPKRDKIEKIKT